MFFEKMREFEQRADKYSLDYINNLHIQLHTGLTLETKLLHSLHAYFSNPKLNAPTVPFQGILLQMAHAGSIKKTQGRLCGGIMKRGDRAYKCLQCITEQNSILCLGCFQLDKHQGHQFELISVFGGCCDCGDAEKWRPETFCHKHSEQEEAKVKIDEDLLEQFVSDQHVGFKIVLVLYAEYLALQEKLKEVKLEAPMFSEEDSKRFRGSVESRVRICLEAYFAMYFQILTEYNSLGSEANAMTHQLFQSHLDLSKLPKVQAFAKGQTKYFKLLFSFLELKKTPEKICELFITLFQLHGFRDRITTQYMVLYSSLPDFPSSSYSHLSSQLFTSYLAIGRLIKENRVPPLTVHPKLQSEADLDDAAQTFVRYYYDINYLGKLHGQAGIEYFIYHAHEGKIADLCDYRRIFNQFPRAKEFYGLQEIFANKMVLLAHLMERDRTGYIMRAALRQLYQFFTNFETRPDNLFRPHERFFTLIAITYLQGDLSRLQDEQIFKEFMQILGVSDIQRQCTIIFQNICTILSFGASLLQNQARISSNFTFYSFYFKKNIIIFNLDALCLQIAVKMCQMHNKLGGKQIDYSKIIMEADKLFGIVRKMRTYCVEELRAGQQSTTKEASIPLQEATIRHCYHYLTLLNEAITSDLPLLAIKCLLQPSPQDIKKHHLHIYSYSSQATHYYSHLLKSCQNNKIQIKDFKTVCDAFFKEEVVFREFVQGHLDGIDRRRLDGQSSKGDRVSMMYFRSAVVRATGLTPNASLLVLPYHRPGVTLPFIQSQAVLIAKKSLQFVVNLQNALQIDNPINAKSTVGNCLRNIFNFLNMILIQTRNNSIYQFIQTAMRMDEFKQHLQYLAPELKAYSKTLPNQQQLEASIVKPQQESKDNVKKEKLSNKRNLMRQRMNKNKEHFLQQVQGEGGQVDQDQSVCCVCKDIKEQEDNCLIAMLSETNYYPLAHISSSNALYTISSCGHEIHRSCYQKILRKYQIYSFCPLCKTPMNMVLPAPTPKNSQHAMARFWEEFHQLNRNYNQGSTYEQEAAILFLSMIGFITVKGLLFRESFFKEYRVYRMVGGLLRFYYGRWKETGQFSQGKQARTLEITMGNGEGKEQVRQIVQFFANELSYNILGIGFNFKPASLSQQFLQYARRLINCLCSESSLQSIQLQLHQISLLRKTIASPSIQSNLSLFSNRFMGKCPNCSLVTNQQAVCLICPSFVTCIKCEAVKLMAHSRNVHRHACSFIKTHNGEVVYIYRNRFWIFESVFEDYMGRSYTNEVNKAQYYLNQKKLQPYLDDVLKNGVESRLRYKEKDANKVNHDQEL